MAEHEHQWSEPVPAESPNDKVIPEHVVCVVDDCEAVHETDLRFGYQWDSYEDMVEFYERDRGVRS